MYFKAFHAIRPYRIINFFLLLYFFDIKNIKSIDNPKTSVTQGEFYSLLLNSLNVIDSVAYSSRVEQSAAARSRLNLTAGLNLSHCFRILEFLFFCTIIIKILKLPSKILFEQRQILSYSIHNNHGSPSFFFQSKIYIYLQIALMS